MCNSGYFLSYVDGLGTSYARSFLGSAHARFCEELYREMSNERLFQESLPLDRLGSQKYIKRSCPVYFEQQMKLCFCPGRL